MAVFAYLGSYSGEDESDYRSILHEYDDGSEREYKKSTFKFRTVTIPFTNVSLTKRNAIQAFFDANRFLDVTLYVWPEATAVDLTGAASTGRHTARIRSSLKWTNNSSCSYSGALTFKLKD